MFLLFVFWVLLFGICVPLHGNTSCLIAVCFRAEGGKSGQHRASYYLTGRLLFRNEQWTDRAAENNRHALAR